ncbi:CaiB/BaiF CoA transferase family protein [Halovenus salina]|uniref:CaiB/BaiF CoA transferase family protein n=1 Tax=Halovenus salina TaxID=1510225 RepID=A0ABD5VXK0_9EURY|nr:CaiB/BaiF CoA-transferase family protein [Halovenus salina]
MQLDGVRILDLSGILPGPYATQLLADMGADVVKIEEPTVGDPARGLSFGEQPLFEAVNRGKRSVGLDLKSDAGREAFYELVADADAVLEGFRPGVVDRLGVDYEHLREYNDDIVYCSLSGYGQTGPDADRVGHDINYVGFAGLLDMTREDEQSRPQLPGYQVADMAGGLMAALSLLGGVLSQKLGNGGGYVDVSMTDVVASFSQTVAGEALGSGDPRPGKTTLTGGVPWYDVYETADGRHVTLGALEATFWERFCHEVDRPALVDVHGTDDAAERAALRDELTKLFGNRPREEWVETLSEEVPVAPVLTPTEALAHPQIADRIVERPGAAPPRVGFPGCGSGLPEHDESVPAHSEHTDEVLREAGYSTDELKQLRADGTVV